MNRGKKWRWENEPIREDPGNVRNKLVIGDALLPVPYVILECGNVDEIYKRRIAAVPELMSTMRDLLSRLPLPDRSMRFEVDQCHRLLERLK
jgi:hypothetical protein